MSGAKGRSGGHNKKTLREKQILGVKKERRGSNAPDYLPARVDKIDGLGDVGNIIWNRYEPMLHNNGTLSETDGMSFFALCHKWEEWYDYSCKVKKHGRMTKILDDNSLIKDEQGNSISLIENVFSKIEGKLFAELQVCLRQFGLNPVDRGSVEKIAREKKVNKFAGLT